MDLNLADQYYLKASENYPYNLEFAIENLNYALSYDDEHPSANCLSGMIYMYQLKDFEQAAKCFYTALQSDINYPETYKHYSLLRLWQGEFERAQKIIDRGMQVIGMDKSALLIIQSNRHEWEGNFSEAKIVLLKAKLLSVDNGKIEEIDSHLSRIKDKLKTQKAIKKSRRKRLAALSKSS